MFSLRGAADLERAVGDPQLASRALQVALDLDGDLNGGLGCGVSDLAQSHTLRHSPANRGRERHIAPIDLGVAGRTFVDR
jgi:hypothetical protein